MAYIKQSWGDYDDTKTEAENSANGAVVTADRMNHMENGIANSADKLNFELLKEEVSKISLIDSGGSNATGFYKKYSDGSLEVEGRKSVFLNIQTPYGALFRNELPIKISYPSGAVFDLTNYIPVVIVTAKGAMTETYGDSTSADFGVYAIKPTSVQNQSVTFEWIVKGRWMP